MLVGLFCFLGDGLVVVRFGWVVACRFWCLIRLGVLRLYGGVDRRLLGSCFITLWCYVDDVLLL